MKPSHYYMGVRGAPGRYQGVIRIATERVTSTGTTHVLHPKTWATLPKYETEADAEEAAGRLVQMLWGSIPRATNDHVLAGRGTR